MKNLLELPREELEKAAAARIELERRRSEHDPVYFVNRFCYTFDPRERDQKDLRFQLYSFQEDYVLKLVDAIRNGYDVFTEKSRDMGISWTTLAVITWFWEFEKDFQALLGSRKEEYVDNWTMKSLFPKIEYIIKRLPWKKETDYERNYMKLVNLVNGAVIEGESANANFSRAGRYNVILFDEIAFWPFQQSSWEAAGDATPCRVAVTTPSEDPSYAGALRDSGLAELLTYHWKLHPKKDEAWYAAEKKRRTTEAVARELDINWLGSLTGLVYPEIQYCTVGLYPFVPDWPLFVSWDFGLDGTAIIWWQVDPSTEKKRMIEAYTRTNEPIHFFMPLFGHPIKANFTYQQADLDLIERTKHWKGAVHYGDPDVAKRAYQSETLTSTREVLAEHRIYVQTNEKSNDLESRKTETKLMLQAGIEVNDTPGTRMWTSAMRQARYPKRQEGSQAVNENVKPIHDWTSHPRTSTEYFAVNYLPPIKYVRRERQYDTVTGRLVS